MLLDIMPATVRQGELDFGDAASPGKANLMAALEALNQRFGRSTVGIASAGLPKSNRIWTMKQERLSRHYTTSWTGLPIVRAS